MFDSYGAGGAKGRRWVERSSRREESGRDLVPENVRLAMQPWRQMCPFNLIVFGTLLVQLEFDRLAVQYCRC